jgi:dihydroneopterin aldolase
MKLYLNGIEVECIIGDLPDERIYPQTLEVDVALVISDTAAHTDALEDTVDYASLTERVREALIAAKCKMIERAAKVVHEVCLSADGVKEARVRVKKSGSVPFLRSAEVEYSGE